MAQAILENIIANAITTPQSRRGTLPGNPELMGMTTGGSALGPSASSALVNVVNPLPQISAAFGGSTNLTVISSPNANEPSQVVSLSQVRSMLQAAGTAQDDDSQDKATAAQETLVVYDVRVPVSRNSLADIVNGGVRLPVGVEQQLFVVRANQ